MSSKWSSAPNQDPLQTRQFRTSAMVQNQSVAPESPPNPAVPAWLVAEQKEFLRSAGVRPPDPVLTAPAKKKPMQNNPSNSSDLPPDDDLIIVDLLDGAHLSTRNSNNSDSMSKNSDSIISLPPIEPTAATPRWSALRAEAQDIRRLQRGGASIGTALPPSYFSASRQNNTSNTPPVPPPRDNLAPSEHHKQNTTAPARQKPSTSRDPGAHSDELQPLLSHFSLPPRPGASHSRMGSYSVATGSVYMEDEASNRSFQSSKEEYHRKGRHRKSHLHDHFRPSVWGWRKPAEEDAIMPNGAWIYLALIGFLTFMIAHSVNSVSQFISTYCISNLANYSASKYGTTPALVTLAALRGLSLAISFLIIWKIAPTYTAGSGIPEMKCVLSGVLMQRMLNWETLMAKMLGLIFSLASSISIGRLGPFIHMSSITAALVSRSSWFPSLRGSARFQLQALSAAMAAGVGATFGAPIGGTMLSIEVMSTYYYIHWLPMALYCSIMGYYFLITVVQPNNEAFFSSSIKVDFQVESVRRLLTYVVLGALCGMIGAAFVQFTMWAFQIRSRHFKTSTPVRTTVMVVIFAAMHTVISSLSTNVLALEQKEGVVELINSMGGNGPSWVQGTWKPFRFEEWNTCLSLLFAMAVKFVLSGLSLIMPVPAGTFMPIFQIGALFGRAFGELLSSFSFVNWVDPRATAIIGAASVVSGALHTTSIAVVMLELTREAIDILPLTVGVIVSYGVSKLLCSDLFSELIKIRKLPFILGLRERYPSENKQFLDDISSVVAGTFMWKDFPFVTPQSTRGDVYKMLTKGGRPWISCAFLSNSEDRRLWGTISQQTMWEAIGEDFNATSGDTVGGSVMYGSFGEDADRISRDNELVPLLRDFDPDVGHALVDMGPMQVSRSTPFWKIVTLFRMLSMNTMYVMKDGMTVGSVNRAQLIQYSYHLEARAKRKRQQEREEQQRIKRQQEEVIGNIQRFSARTNRLASRPSPTDIDVSMAMAGRRGSRHGSRHSSRQGSFSNVRGSNW